MKTKMKKKSFASVCSSKLLLNLSDLSSCPPADPCTSCAGTSPANSSTAPKAGGSVLFGAAALDFAHEHLQPVRNSQGLASEGFAPWAGQLLLNRSGGSKVSVKTRCRVRCHLVAQRDHSFRACKSS